MPALRAADGPRGTRLHGAQRPPPAWGGRLTSGPPPEASVAEALATPELEIVGLLPAASNVTLLARLEASGPVPTFVVYKPRRGEAPLWDFPPGTLCRREVAAYLVSEAGGWGFVPPTILRDGPLGFGAVQRFVEHDPECTAFDLLEDRAEDLQRICLFDLAVNNADRKAGHVFLDADGRIWAVDHGICFHAEPKLRTVLWDYVGQPIPDAARAPLVRLGEALRGEVRRGLAGLLAAEELAALERRTAGLATAEVFPPPGPGRHYPWPPL